MGAGLYVQYGCGFSDPPGWLNFDASPTLRFERSPIGFLYTRNERRFPKGIRYGDIVSGLPIDDASCRGLFCSHILEHLSLEECDRALANSFRYLERGGTFRMALPDLEIYAREYLANPSAEGSVNFMQASGLGREQRSRGLSGLLQYLIGHSTHQWMWDERSLHERLRQHGFVDIRRAAFGDAEDTRFTEVEELSRFEGFLAMQCRK